MSNFILFAVFPYVALAIFLTGTVYRYRAHGFMFSSLSSQFLEGRQLFWGSLLFHLGILFLFLGHLIAFLFPRSLLAWNGAPVRLMILEGSMFAFALCALIGLLTLIKRRASSSRVRIVTTRMDLLVLAILLLQVGSGIWVALSYRWGSAWFAAVLTPYLRSIFGLNPQIEAIAAMPFAIKLHLISAMVIVAIVPFTRLVHFLVPPINYSWRSYQQVIWNWDRRKIRNPAERLPTISPRNN